MPQGKPTPRYKFRLLCRRCNSYLYTTLEVDEAAAGLSQAMQVRLYCSHCGNEADTLDETAE